MSVHGPHALSGVSTWIARLLRHAGARHEWHALVVGSERDVAEAENFPARDTGRVHMRVWSDDEFAVTEHADVVRSALRELDAEVVIPNYVPEAYAAAGLEAARGLRTIGVCHSRDYWYLELLKHTAPLLHGAWAVSGECEALVRSVSGEGVPVLCAPYGMPLPAQSTRPPFLTSEDGRIRLLFSGRLESQQKRSLRLADLADELRAQGVRFQLTIAGDGPDRDSLYERTRRHREEGAVRLVGAVSHAEIERLIRSHDALVLLSAFEGTPLAAIESMAHGRPVFITDGCGGAADAVRSGGGGVVTPTDDLRAMVRAIRDVAARRGAFERLASEARAVAERRFDIGAHVASLEGLVDRALEPVDDASRPTAQETWRAVGSAASLAVGGWPEDVRELRLSGWRRAFVRDHATSLAERARLRMTIRARAPRVDRLGSSLLRVAVDELAAQGCRSIAVFPAGRHSSRHGHALREHPAVACYADDAHDGSSRRTLHEKKVLTPDEAVASGIDAIVVSSDTYEEALEARAREWGGGLPVRTLYVPVRLPGKVEA